MDDELLVHEEEEGERRGRLEPVVRAFENARNRLGRAWRHVRRRRERPAAAPVHLMDDVTDAERHEHDRGGAPSIDLLVAMSIQGDDGERKVVEQKLHHLSHRALARFSQTLQERYRATRPEAEKEREKEIDRRIEATSAELKEARAASASVRSHASRNAREFLDHTDDVRKLGQEADLATSRVRANQVRVAELAHLRMRVLDFRGRHPAEEAKADLALARIDERVAKAIAETQKQREACAAAQRDQEAANEAADHVELDGDDEDAVFEYGNDKVREAGLGGSLMGLMQARDTPVGGAVGKLVELAESLATLKARSAGTGLGIVGTAYGRGDSTGVEGSAAAHGVLTAEGPMGSAAADVEVVSPYEEPLPPGVRPPTIDETRHEAMGGAATDIIEEVVDVKGAEAEVAEAIVHIEDPGLRAAEELLEERKKEILLARTGISCIEARKDGDWTWDQLSRYVDTRLVHIDLQLDLVKAHASVSGAAQLDRRNLGAALEGELEASLRLLGARVGMHSTPYQFETSGEHFVVGGMAVVDAYVGARLRTAGKAAVAVGHHDSGPTVAADADASVFLGAEASIAGAFTLDWNRKSLSAYTEDLGERLAPFLTKIGLQNLPDEMDADAEDLAEILGEMEQGSVGDTLVASLEARVAGQVGAGAEALARAGFFGGVVEAKAAFGFTVGTGFSSDVTMRFGLYDTARLSAIMFIRRGLDLFEGVVDLASWGREVVIPAIKRWVRKPATWARRRREAEQSTVDALARSTGGTDGEVAGNELDDMIETYNLF